MAAPLLAQVYFIINKESGLACDLGPGIPGSERPVIGLPFNGHDSQKWRFTRYDQYWVIQNITDGRFMDIQTPPGVAPGAPVITKDEREWEVAHDEQFDGWRFIIPQTPLNTGLPSSIAKTPVILELRAPIKNQVWELRAADK